MLIGRVAKASVRSAVSRRENVIAALEPAPQPKFGWLEFHGAIFVRTLHLIAESRERIKRERIAVEVILQIKHARKSGAGKIGFAPRAIRILLVDQISDRLLNRRIIGLGAREQPNQAPSGLRCRAVSLPFGGRIGVAPQGFAE